MVFGYACNETPELMPLPISLAQKLAKKLTEVRKSGVLPYLRADGKTQVTVEYHDDKPVRIDSVVISSQHSDAVTLEQIREDVIREVVTPTLPALYMDDDTKIYVNPTGRFVVGGPKGDSGLTGRKIIVETYGGYAATAAAPSAARTRPRSTAAPRIWRAMRPRTSSPRVWPRSARSRLPTPSGVARPLSVFVNTFGTGKAADDAIARAVCKVIDLRPAAIIEKLDLRRPIYKALAAYGHFGREELGVSWEKTDCAEALAAAVAE